MDCASLGGLLGLALSLEYLDVVAVQLPIGADERQAFKLSLRHQQPVKRIAVVHRQCSYAAGMGYFDG